MFYLHGEPCLFLAQFAEQPQGIFSKIYAADLATEWRL